MLTVPLIVLLLVAVPWNMDAFEQGVFGPRYMAQREFVLRNIVRLPEARDVPRSHRPIADVFVSPTLTMGWLLDAERAGKLDPSTEPLTPAQENELRILLGIDQTFGPVPPNCRTLSEPLDVQPDVGTVFVIKQPVTVSTIDGATSRPVTLNRVAAR